jgi:hypothetical protein
MLGVLLLGFGGAWMTGACGAPVESGCPAPGADPPVEQPSDCSMPTEMPCMRYLIPLAGDPNADLALRAKYIAAFGSACYLSEANTFDCFYKDWKAACADAVKIGEVSGNAPYDKGYTCQPVGNGDYTLQIGPDVANKLTIYYQAAPRQTPLIDIKGIPTEVNGPYRNLTEPQKLGPGEDFYCNTFDKNGATIKQKDLILQVNRDAHGGAIHSDLAGFTYPCGVDENCKPKTCTEPLVLKAGPKDDPEAAQVHHVVPRLDKRGCPWGTNSNKNAVVISGRLNRVLFNKEPPIDEVVQINKVPPYTP